MSWVRSFKSEKSSATAMPVQGLMREQDSFELFEVLVDKVGDEDWLRFRFLAPDIATAGSDLPFEEIQIVFERLCGEIAIPYLGEFDLSADVIVITLLDRPVAFGATDPEATQLIEAFKPRGDACIWEGIW